MFWGLLALALSIWLIAVFYIVKGWGESRGKEVLEVIPPKIKVPPPLPLEWEKKEEKLEEEIEIPILGPSREEPKAPIPIDWEGFCQEFGKANIVEFPAEYIDRDSVKGLSGNRINVVEFAKNCYREIDFRCIDSIIIKKEEYRIYKVNIFDLVSDHYASTEEGFITFFNQTKEKLAQEIESINSHPDINPINKKALVRRYEAMPQLIVWNDKELFLVWVKSIYDTLSKIEIDFIKEFIIEKRLFKAKIFKVTQKQERIEIVKKEEEKERLTRKPFTEEEIKFLVENKDKYTNEELAKRLGRSIDSVTHKLSRLGIARESYEWTEEKDNFLKDNIAKFSYRELAEKLGTTIPSVRARCKKLDIKK